MRVRMARNYYRVAHSQIYARAQGKHFYAHNVFTHYVSARRRVSAFLNLRVHGKTFHAALRLRKFTRAYVLRIRMYARLHGKTLHFA
jgi:hypothetical protein